MIVLKMLKEQIPGSDVSQHMQGSVWLPQIQKRLVLIGQKAVFADVFLIINYS